MIRRYFAVFTTQIAFENGAGNFDINKRSETFLIPILNYLFKTNFERLEFSGKNYPAIDIGSKDLEVSFQITSEARFDKIKSTLTGFLENRIYTDFPVLFHLVLRQKYLPSVSDTEIQEFINNEIDRIGLDPKPAIVFSKGEHVWDISTLLKKIEQDCDFEGLKAIKDHCEKEYGNVTSLPSFHDMLIPYEIVFQKQLDETNDNLPYQFHTPFFGRESELEKIQLLYEQPTVSAISIVGDGGYGKTRLIVELFNHLTVKEDSPDVYVLNEAAFRSQHFAEQINTDKKILVLFDDAHKKLEILNDLIGFADRFENLKLILTIRKALYADTIKSISTHRRNIESIELPRLSYGETLSLFKSQLPHLKEEEIKRLAEESKGVPIVILGLCSITLQGKYKSELSEETNFMLFVNEVKDQVITDIHSRYYIARENINKTIELISYFAPIKNSPDEITALARLNNLSFEETSLIIDYLSEYGLIEKRADISIKPDPYSDAILLESAPRIKYLLQQEIGIFLDRLIRNLVEVEQSSRININIESLLTGFITSFKNKPLDSNQSIKDLESNLETLKSFTYKKPRLCFFAIKYLIESHDTNSEFWGSEESLPLYSNSFKSVHVEIETILSIAALNTHTRFEFDEIYDLLVYYQSKRHNGRIFQKVFTYRIYDFNEYGYYPVVPCERQTYLVRKIINEIDKGDLTQETIDHLLNCCKTLLSLEFETESHFDKYTHSFTYGRANVIFNETTKYIRETTLSFLFKIYKDIRNTSDSELFFQEILKPLIFTAETKRAEYIFPQDNEVKAISIFLQSILKDNPNMFERSSIIKQLKLFERKEIKEEYKDLVQELLSLSENVSTNKERLKLLLRDDYFSLKNTLEERINKIIENYPDSISFFSDLVEARIELPDKDYSNFYEIINHLAIAHPVLSRTLLQYIVDDFPDQSCHFASLIKGNCSDNEFFYYIIDKIWQIDLECCKAAVIWMLTRGRNQDIKLYKNEDLDYFEYIVENKMLSAIGPTYFTLSKYILINPKRTLEVIAGILRLCGNNTDAGFLLHSIFENKEIIESHSDLIKDFVLKDTIEFPIDSHYIEDILSFLEDYFGFEVMFDYLKRKTALYASREQFLGFSLQKHYNNHNKCQTQMEIDFLSVIEWYVGLEVESRYFHNRLLEFLRPAEINSNEFKEGFRTMVREVGDNKKRIIEICNALDVYEIEGEVVLAMLIEIANDLCDKFLISNDELIEVFGRSFIYNTQVKAGTAGQPFPQDIRHMDLLKGIIENYKLHPQVKDILLFAVRRVEEDIARDRHIFMEDQW
jgi:GTPase SAR1 family protein